MRKLERKALDTSTLTVLSNRTSKIFAKTTEPKQRAEAKRLWKSKNNKAFDDIRKKLQTMASDGQCMYCGVNEGTDIEHFFPKTKYPLMAFRWCNYLAACTRCNSNYKRDRFPLDEQGRPLLIQPTKDEPRAHIFLSPSTGDYVGETEKGENSIDVYGLNRSTLPKNRAKTLVALQQCIIRYGEQLKNDELDWAANTRDSICGYPLASVFHSLLDIADSELKSCLHPRCLETLQQYPEIKEWVNA
ncbi:MAG: hypothetical protein GY765_15315 [bacterium]|nr:hypothetical protein [bacterium]